MFKPKMIFYAEDQIQGTPAEPSPAPAPVAAPEPGGVPTPTRVNTKSVLDKAPIIGQEKPKETPEGKESKDEPEVIVSGPGEGKQPATPDPKSKEPEPDEPKKGEEVGDDADDKGKVTIGGLSYSEHEWARFAKDYEQDTSWRAANTKKSQVINKFDDDIINELAPYALGQKEVPKDLKDKMVSDIGSMEFTVKDPDGYDIKVKGSDLPEEVIDSIRQNVIAEVFPKYAQMNEDYTNLKETHQQTQDQVSQSQVESGIKHSLEFMQSNPEFAITVRQGEKLSDVLAGIFKAGETHPEYHNAQRFTVLAKSINDGIYPDFAEAYKGVFGKEIARKNVNDQVIENQEAGVPETPGLSPGSVNPILQRVASRNSKTARYNTLNR